MTTLSSNPIAINSNAAYNYPANWLDRPDYGIGTEWIGPMNQTQLFRDIGFYGNATVARGMQGNAGRSTAPNSVDLHIDWSKELGGNLGVPPSVDVFNLSNTYCATAQLMQVTTQGGTAETRYGAAIAWQQGRRYRFGVKIQF